MRRLKGCRGRSSPLVIFCLFGILLFAQASTLPIHLGFLFVAADAKAMTKGCKHKTCCTPLCYIDKDGKHHCVHKHHESCGCDTSLDDFNPMPTFLSSIVTLPIPKIPLPALIPEGWINQLHPTVKICYTSPPNPPPR